MIVSALFNMLFGVVMLVIGLLPAFDLVSIELSNTSTLIGWALNFFPPDLFAQIVIAVSAWYGIMLIWSIIEWVYRKFPGVD